MARPGFWWAVAAGYGYGGRTVVNGSPRETLQKNFRFTGMIAFPLSARAGVSVAFGSGRNAGAGADFDSVAVAYQIAF